MSYFKRLEKIRHLVMSRKYNQFVYIPLDVEFLVAENDRYVYIYDTHLSKKVFHARAFRQFNFFEKTLSLLDDKSKEYIQYFIDHSLAFVDGAVHCKLRQKISIDIEELISHLNNTQHEKLINRMTEFCTLNQELDQKIHSNIIAKELILFFVESSLGYFVKDNYIQLDSRLFEMDFFAPVPKLSIIKKVENNLQQVVQQVDWQSLSESKKILLLSILIMGISPVHASLTVLLNHLSILEKEQKSISSSLLKKRIRQLPYEIVPTNFVMRECQESIEIDHHLFQENDILYLFLGKPTGCPFTQLTSLPFGSGKHRCIGEKLTYAIFDLALNVILESRIYQCVEFVTPKQGKTSAFLEF